MDLLLRLSQNELKTTVYSEVRSFFPLGNGYCYCYPLEATSIICVTFI